MNGRDAPHIRRARAARRLFLTVVATSLVLLIPWIWYLADRLPRHHQVKHWDVAWVGFDITLALGLVVTGWLAWQRRQLVVPAAVITGTLLCCDAWFDVVLDWGSEDVWWSLAGAVLVELPLAGLMFYSAARILHITMAGAWARMGAPGDVPPLRKIRLSTLLGSETPVGQPPDK